MSKVPAAASNMQHTWQLCSTGYHACVRVCVVVAWSTYVMHLHMLGMLAGWL